MWSKPFREDEIEYIQNVFPQMSAPAIAKKLGRSTSGVNAKIRELGLRKKPTPRAHAREDAPAPVPAAKQEKTTAQDTLDMLRELREIQRQALIDAEPRNLPSISAEYRATLAEIDRLENDTGEKEGGDPLEALIINLGVRST